MVVCARSVCALVLPLLTLGDGRAGSLQRDTVSLVQGSVQLQHKQPSGRERGMLSLLQGEREEAEEEDSAEAAAATEASEGPEAADTELEAQVAKGGDAAQADAEVPAQALADELDSVTYRLVAARKTLRRVQKTAAEGLKKTKSLEDENSTAMVKWERAHDKRVSWDNQVRAALLKEAERADLKGKHVHLDVEAYVKRIKKGNLSSYGLWNTSDEKQHFWEKTWDIVSNHIFGLDKLAKHVWNATDYGQKANKYHKLEKFFSAKAAAATQELQDTLNSVQAAEVEAVTAQEQIANLTARKAEILEAIRRRRKT